MTNKELYQDCSCIPVFVWGVLWFDLMIFMTQQMLVAHVQLHGDKEWHDG